MAVVLNTIYPPQVETFMPSFCYNSPAEIWFSVSTYNEDMINKIKFIHVSMVDQRNNRNVFSGVGNKTYPQYYPIIFSPSSMWDSEKKQYKLTIPPQVLKTRPYYNVGQYYKVQLRFDLTGSSGFPAYSAAYSDPTSFFYWNSSSNNKADALGLASYTNYNEENFSEWSTGTLIKPIHIPELALQKFIPDPLDPEQEVPTVVPSTDIPVIGKIRFKEANGKESRIEDESLSWYQIKIFDKDKNTVFFSDKIYSDSKTSRNQLNYKLDTSMLQVGSNYQMKVTYETIHGYQNSVNYSIKIKDYDNVTRILYTSTINEEKGAIILDMRTPTNPSTGKLINDGNGYTNSYLIIRRSSHYSNFTEWKWIGKYEALNLNEGLTVVDNTVESMVGYRYQLQIVSYTGNILYEPLRTHILHCDFYGGIFSDKEKTLQITFDFQLSNRANAVNRTKTDTIGGQYPIFTQNAKLKYRTYNISGKISSEDSGELFLPKEQLFGSEYYEYRYNPVIDQESPHTAECQAIPENNDWLYEREYRDAVEEWLNNGKPKLFRSMTEGNMIVILDGITMTPEVSLGRRLYNFNATMYEVEDGKDFDKIVATGLFQTVGEK